MNEKESLEEAVQIGDIKTCPDCGAEIEIPYSPNSLKHGTCTGCGQEFKIHSIQFLTRTKTDE
ncbi:hypothetical protein [Haloarcula amylolytica]|uniref:hypothetical protein n=1 Tax=Haloarcula amylolytica TaxID=396317 RepID=UPI003C7077CE